MPYKQSQWTVHLQVDGVDKGYWAVMEGGGVTSEDGSYPDWDGDVRLGGKRSREDVTLRRLYREQVHADYRWLDDRAGNAGCVITRTPTGDDGVSWGSPIVITGKLGGVKPPDIDKGSSDGGEIELTVQCDTNLA